MYSKGLFEEDSPELDKFTRALPNIKYKAQSLLGIPDAFSLLMDLPSDRAYYDKTFAANPSTFKITRTNNKITTLESCHCSQTDPYCNVGNCRAASCDEGLGCGTLFLYTCNGNCSLI